MAKPGYNRTVRIPADLADALQAVLTARGESFNAWVNRMARHETTDAATRPEKE